MERALRPSTVSQRASSPTLKIRLAYSSYGASTARGTLCLKKELEALEKQYPERLRVVYAVSGPEAAVDAPSLGDAEKWRKGYVDKTLLQEAIERANKQGAWGDAKGQKVFLCGPPKMEDAIAGKNGVLGGTGSCEERNTSVLRGMMA